MTDNRSWRTVLLHLGILMGLCLVLGIYLIHRTVVITRDGTFYIDQARQFGDTGIDIAQRYPAGYPVLVWAAHRVGLGSVLVPGSSSHAGNDTLLWVYAGQSVTLLCRVLALVPLYFLGKLLVGARHSFWALLILIALPYPAQYGSDVLREWPYLLFLSLGFWLLYRGLCQRQRWVFVLVGLAAGLGSLIRPECIQLVLYGLLGLACGDGGEDQMPLAGGRRWIPWGAGPLLIAGFLVPVAPYVYAAGRILPPQLHPTVFNTPPVISAVGPKAACDEPLDFEVRPGQLLELPITATDPDGDPLTFSLQTVPLGARPVYQFRSTLVDDCIWTASQQEKDFVFTVYPRELYHYEGIAFYSYLQPEARPGLLLVRRFWLPQQQRHLYTTDEAEVRTIVEQTPPDSWRHEGVAFYAFGPDQHPPEAVPVYRYGSRQSGCSWMVGSESRGHGLGGSPTRADSATGTVVWYVEMGGPPAAGATIERGVLRWRPGPGQEGEYQLNVIVSDGELPSCQLVRIRVTAGAGAERAWFGNGPSRVTRDGRQRQAQLGDGESSRRGTIAKAGGLDAATQRAPTSHIPSESRSVPAGLCPQHAGLGAIPDAVRRILAGVTEDLMVILTVPWVIGLYWRLKYRAGRRERILISAVALVSFVLMLGRHLGLDTGEDRRYSLGLIALTIFYVPVGLELTAGWLAQRGLPALFGLSRFHLLVAASIAVCLPKLLLPSPGNKAGYRAAAEWLRANTKAEDVLAVPDIRISFYAERQGLLYEQYPDWRRADHVVVAGREGQVRVPEGWRQEYSGAIDRRSKGILVIYTIVSPGQ